MGLIASMLVFGGLMGCDFFKELESQGNGSDTEGDTDADTEGDTETGADTDDADGECDLSDDFCADQDTLHSCNFETLEATVYDCGQLCTNLNFTCLDAGNGLHGCWCVTPDPNGYYTCTDLEGCLVDCGTNATGACGAQCFSRTTSATIRLYGALIACAEIDCRDTCLETPENCFACVVNTKAGLTGNCGLERTVCDADEPDDEPWP